MNLIMFFYSRNFIAVRLSVKKLKKPRRNDTSDLYTPWSISMALM